MIRVWSDRRDAGVIDRLAGRGSTFAYMPSAASQRAVSLTMPVQVQSWDWRTGVLPIFEMNLPEGALKERLARGFVKATGYFDDFDLLSLVGQTQLGRIRCSEFKEDLEESVPFQSVDEILGTRRDSGLFDHLLDRFARYSGLSGIQPKVLIRDEIKLSGDKGRLSANVGATHIVKLWDKTEYPELAANEFFCLTAARKAGLEVPPFLLSDAGDALVIERFDLTPSGYLGLEDFCVLNEVFTARKYDGGYETKLFRRLRDFVAPTETPVALEALYRLFVLNCALRNGDAHLKNFALLYEGVEGPTRLAPVYDVVTTTAYLPSDVMALTLEGSRKWPDPKRLGSLGQLRAELGAAEVKAIFEETADALSDTWSEAEAYFAGSTDASVGNRMHAAWQQGIAESLGLAGRIVPVRIQLRRRLSSGQRAILKHLREHDGSYTGSLRALAGALGLPKSTVHEAVRALVRKGALTRDEKSLRLVWVNF